MSFYHFGGLVFINETTFSKNQLIKNVFIGGAAIFLYGTTYYCLVYVKDSSFIENYSQLKGGAIATTFGQVHCRNCTFIDNNAPYGGAVNVAVYCPGSYINSRFSSKKSSFYGGGIFLADESVVTILNCSFEGLSAEFGGAIKMEGLQLSLILNNVTFKGNRATRGAALDFSNSLKIYTNMTLVSFQGNECVDSIVNLGNMALMASGISFSLNKGRIFQLKTVILSILNLTVKEHICEGVDMVGCGGYFQELSFVNISNANISKINSNFVEDLFSVSESSLTLSNIKVSAVITESRSTVIFSKRSDLVITNLLIEGLNGEIFNLEDSSLKIEGITVNDVVNNKSDYATIYCTETRSFLLRNGKFFNVKGKKLGGAIAIIKGKGKNEIFNSSFEKCNSLGKGGAVYISQGDLNISLSKFISNIAEESGGSLFFDCDLANECVWNISNNSFVKNSAKISGGAYHSNAFVPYGRKSNFFLENSAAYGPDYSSFPVRITLQGRRILNFKNGE